ncbi:MAG TPA: M23 family metallopeptidase [Pyrinomonadaceae bacterium]|jgi:hypothetical protein|nr:M23 family metallopeptidase [Pyrinomonadaceae bacterium]
MNFNRRKFLGALLGWPIMIGAGVRRFNLQAQTRAGAGQLSLTNHQPGNRAMLKEGKTLVATIRFPFPANHPTGSLPVKLADTDASGAQLTEPQPLFFYAGREAHTFHTILSAPLDAIEGTYNLHLSVPSARDAALEWSFPYAIERGVYPESALTLDENFSSPPPEVAARMQRDFERMVEIYQRRTTRRWQAPFIRPVNGPDKDNFGYRRVVNRTKRYSHGGLDYRAPKGTPVRAINDAIVALSEEQWTPGQVICLDHGGGIFSRYIHLSERRVRAGDIVTRGQIIALSGNTGGQKPPPHLHMDMVVNGTHVDPKDFINTAAQLEKAEAGG